MREGVDLGSGSGSGYSCGVPLIFLSFSSTYRTHGIRITLLHSELTMMTLLIMTNHHHHHHQDGVGGDTRYSPLLSASPLTLTLTLTLTPYLEARQAQGAHDGRQRHRHPPFLGREERNEHE